MRLTHVGQLRLPFGRLMGFDVSLSEPGRSLPVSFDQRRHVRPGGRPGTWMAVSCRLPGQVSRDELADAWLAVMARHGTLRTVFVADGAGVPHLHEVEVLGGEWVEHPIAPGQAVNDALRDVLDAACSPYERPSHRLCVVETADGPTLVFGSDHSHVDMWSLLVIVRDFLGALVRSSNGDPPPDAVPAFAEHTSELRDRGDVPDDVRRRWSEILTASGGVMPRFPLPLGPPTPQPERVEVRDVFDVDDSVAFSAQAGHDGVSTLALAVAAMTEVTRELAEAPLRALFPVHSRYSPSWHDSVGWFITNAVIESADPAPAAASAAVKEAIRLGSWPLDHILQPWGGMPEAPGMFAISWLDLRRLPVRVDTAALQAQYVGAAMKTDGVMLWFILDESGLHLRCRYPDHPEARASVGAWLDRLVARLQDLSHQSVRGIIHVNDRTYRLQRAVRGDILDVVALLAPADRQPAQDADEVARYEAAYDVIARDRSHLVSVARDESDRIVGGMQLTMIPGLARGGATRLQVEGLWVAESQRSQGLGAAMMRWAHDHGRARGATRVHVTADDVSEEARGLYTRLGYTTDHIGFQREL